MSNLDITVINGSAELNKLSLERFSELNNDEKNSIRIQYAERLAKMTGTLISEALHKILCKSKSGQAKGGLQSKRSLGFPLNCHAPAS